jgi:hypothetical protein
VFICLLCNVAMCFYYVFVFATSVKLCHDLMIQSAFEKMASRGHPSIQSDGWVCDKFLYSVHRSTSLLHLSCRVRGDSVKCAMRQAL